MIPSYSEQQHYENWAIYFANSAIALRCAASVHVEAFDDAVFWEKVMNYSTSYSKKFNFIWHSLTPSGSDATGVSHCLKFKPYLSAQFLICIDSDYRYLLQDSDISAANYIFQTYTYSIENHLCFSGKLNDLPQKSTGLQNTVFNFDTFLKDYSQAIYDALIWHLYLLKQGDVTTFSINEFIQIFQLLQPAGGYDIEHNGQAIIDELSHRCATKINAIITQFHTVDIEKEKIYFDAIGVFPENAYLFVRGHNLYDLISRIGNKVNERLMSIEKAKLQGSSAEIKKLYENSTSFKFELDKEIVFERYVEIERIRLDVKSIFP
jgi:hypothetical protein